LSAYLSFQPEQAGNYVYCLRPNGLPVIPIVTDMLRPNGLCFSPDESLLYVADSGAAQFPKYDQPSEIECNWSDPHHVRVYDIVNGFEAKNGQVFTDIENGKSSHDFYFNIHPPIMLSIYDLLI
jgi:gluconolactonase